MYSRVFRYAAGCHFAHSVETVFRCVRGSSPGSFNACEQLCNAHQVCCACVSVRGISLSCLLCFPLHSTESDGDEKHAGCYIFF